MPRGYKRNFFAVESSLIDHPKWMELTWAERGKWLVVRALAERQPSDDFRDRTYLSILLKKEGDESPGETIDRLIEVRMLDVQIDGRITVHDIAEWTPDKSTLRVQRLREAERNGPKRTETARDIRERDQNAGAPAMGEGGRPREDGETLKQYLDRIGAPIPDVAKQETNNGKIEVKPEGRSNDDGKSGRRPRRDPAAPIARVRRGEVAPANDVPDGSRPEPKGARRYRAPHRRDPRGEVGPDR